MRPTLAAAVLALSGCFHPVQEGPPIDGGTVGDAGPCGDLYCPPGCDISADCTSCIPQSPTAGLGGACQSDLDCCTGKCEVSQNGPATPGDRAMVCVGTLGGGPADGGQAARAVGSSCKQNIDCTSDYCRYGVCACNAPNRGYVCASSSDCCNGDCSGGVCVGGPRGGPDSGTPGCVAQGSDPYVGAWTGTASVVESFGGGPASGGGGGGPDSERTVASGPNQFTFQNFLASKPGLAVLQPGCALTFAESGAVATMTGGEVTCPDTSGGSWVFTSGMAKTDSGGCFLDVTVAGTFADPVDSSGNGSVSLTLHR